MRPVVDSSWEMTRENDSWKFYKLKRKLKNCWEKKVGNDSSCELFEVNELIFT